MEFAYYILHVSHIIVLWSIKQIKSAEMKITTSSVQNTQFASSFFCNMNTYDYVYLYINC